MGVRCYADALGDCDGRQSSEHIISASILRQLNEVPLVDGWPGIAAAGPIGIGSLKSKILCEKHNRFLAPFDSSAADFFATLSRFDRSLGEKAAVVDEVVPLSGHDLERWLLKVAFGLAALNSRRDQAAQRVRAHADMLGVLFGREAWPKSWGFYVSALMGVPHRSDATLTIETGVHPSLPEIYSLTAKFRFLEVVLALGLPNAPSMVRRPAGIELVRPGSPAVLAIDLEWADSEHHDYITFGRAA